MRKLIGAVLMVASMSSMAAVDLNDTCEKIQDYAFTLSMGYQVGVPKVEFASQIRVEVPAGAERTALLKRLDRAYRAERMGNEFERGLVAHQFAMSEFKACLGIDKAAKTYIVKAD